MEQDGDFSGVVSAACGAVIEFLKASGVLPWLQPDRRAPANDHKNGVFCYVEAMGCKRGDRLFIQNKGNEL